jgi:O-acetyl-ADP-ribose deacetylase (regulator of RNase III)
MRLVEAIAQDLAEFLENMFDFPATLHTRLSAISGSLGSLRNAFEKRSTPFSMLTPQYASDIELIAWVLQNYSGGVVEIVEQTKYTRNFGEPTHKSIWDDFNFHLANSSGLDSMQLLGLLQTFVSGLRDVLVIGSDEPNNMEILRTKLDAWRKKRIGGKSQRERFDEIMYTRQFSSPPAEQDTGPPSRTGNIQLNTIPSLFRLYQLGELEYRPTNAIPNRRQLYTVCLAREDITRLEIDAITNSTDPYFRGMGTLDRSIFRKGGHAMQEECDNFGECEEGDVRITKGHLLPVRYVLHTIPPETMKKNTKDVLRRIYRDILFTATNLKVKSIAIPSIGTGMLNYPRRECAALAMEEVKRFLETMESNSTLEKIIFCVYSSNDEFIYKSLLPVYFPPIDLGNKALPEGTSATPQQDLGASTSSFSSDISPPKRTLFRSIGDAFRGVRFGKQPVPELNRPLITGEEDALINFETHARSCPTCSNISKMYNEAKNLCQDGYAAAQLVLQYLYMESNQTVYSTHLHEGKRVTVDIPAEYLYCRELLVTVERSYRDSHRSRPFVTPNQPWPENSGEQEEETPPTVAIPSSNVTFPIRDHQRNIVVNVSKWSKRLEDWEPLFQNDCYVSITPSGIDFFLVGGKSRLSALLIGFNSFLDVKKGAADVLVKTQDQHRYLLRTQNSVDCDVLYQRIQKSRPPSEALTVHFEDPPMKKAEAQTADAQKAVALIFAWSEEDKQLLPLHPEECNIYIEQGRVYVYEMDEQAHTQVPLLSLEMTPLTSLIKSGKFDVAVKARTLSDSRLKSENEIVFRSRSGAACEELFQSLKHVARRNPQYEAHQSIRGSADEPLRRVTPSQIVPEDVHNTVVRIFGRPQLASDWQMMFPGQCLAVVEPGKLTIHEMNIERATVVPLVHLRLPRSRAIHIWKSNETDIIILPTPEVWEKSRVSLEGEFALACRNKEETEQLLIALKSALVEEPSERPLEQGTPENPVDALPGLPSPPTHDPSLSPGPKSLLTQKIQALQSRSDSLASSPLPPTTLPPTTLPSSNLPEMSVSRAFLNQSQNLLELSKTSMQLGAGLHLEMAASRLNTTPERALRLAEYLRDVGLARISPENLIYAIDERPYSREFRAQSRFLREAEESQLENVTLLAKRVLSLLKSLPTEAFNSYDLHQQDIASWLQVDGADVVRALNQLRNLKLVEKTLDEQTWTAVGNDVPVVNAALAEQRPRSPKRGLLPASQPSISRGPSPGPADDKLDLSISGLSTINIDDFFTYLDLALGTDQLATGPPTEPAEPRPLTRSTTLDTFDRSSKPRASQAHALKAPPYWAVSDDKTAPNTILAEDEEDLPMVSHPRPTSPDHDQPKPIPPGARWTKIDRRIVNAQALEEANERFEQREDSNIVLRVLSRDEIMKYAERTREIRRGREELKEFARKVGDDEDYRGKGKGAVR